MAGNDPGDLQARKQALLEELQKIEAMERQQKEEAEREAAEAKRKADLEKPIKILIEGLSGDSIIIHNQFREDLLEILKATPGRAFRGNLYGQWQSYGKNLIPIGEFGAFIAKVEALPKVTIAWQKDLKKEIHWYLNAAPWEVVVHPSRQHFLATVGPRENAYRILSHIPGADWDHSSHSWKIPATEGWRIFKALNGVEGVVYSDDAKEIIFEQVRKRTELDQLAKKEDSDLIKSLNGHELRAFQRVGIEFAYTTGGRILLADGTGLGKTWQALGFAELHRKQKPDYLTLCIVKAANMPNWVREIDRLTGLEPLVLKGGKPEFFSIQKVLKREINYVLISQDTLGSYQKGEDTIIRDEAGNEVARKDGETIYPWAGVFKAAKPDFIIIDEAHQIKNPDTHRSRAARQLAQASDHMFAMTASPILNRTEELWPILYMVDPQLFKVHDQFLSTYTYGGKRPRNVEQLHELLRPMFLRRRKADVQKDLPPINRIVRYHDLTDEARASYDEVLAGIWRELAEFDPFGIGGTEMNIMSMLAQITRLKQVCAADKVEYTADLATELKDEASDNGRADRKVLIFSHFLGTAHAIAQRLGSGAVCTVKLNAAGDDFVSMSVDQRDALFEAARNDPDVDFIVTTEAAKEGHNMEFCDWTIFNDPFWTPAAHDQCEGRAYGRLSDPHSIDSFYIVADVQIERWIMELLEQKLQIIQEAVEGVEATRDISGSLGMELIKRMKEEMWSR